MSVTYAPAAADARFESFAGQPFADPVAYLNPDARRIDAKFFLKPLQDEVLQLIALALRGSAALPVRNESGALFAAGTLACITGFGNGRFSLAKADAGEAAKAPVVVLTAALADGAGGLGHPFAEAAGLDTSAAGGVGAPVYLDPAVPGAWSFEEPALGARRLQVGFVTFKDAAAGRIAFQLRPPLVALLGDLHDVDLSGLADGFTLQWNAAAGKWTVAANATSDEKVKSDVNDPAAGFLEAKADGSTLEVNAATHKLRVKDGGVTYAKLQNVGAADRLLGRAGGGAGGVEEIACTAAGRALLDDADAAAQRATLSVAPKHTLAVKTAAYSVATGDVNAVFNNAGAAAEVALTLPAASAGAGPFTFYCADTDGLKIRAGSGDAIRIGAGQSSAAGYALSTAIGSALTLVGLDSDTWVALASVGTWSVA